MWKASGKDVLGSSLWTPPPLTAPAPSLAHLEVEVDEEREDVEEGEADGPSVGVVRQRMPKLSQFLRVTCDPPPFVNNVFTKGCLP